jgi:hypothetical protein
MRAHTRTHAHTHTHTHTHTHIMLTYSREPLLAHTNIYAHIRKNHSRAHNHATLTHAHMHRTTPKVLRSAPKGTKSPRDATLTPRIAQWMAQNMDQEYSYKTPRPTTKTSSDTTRKRTVVRETKRELFMKLSAIHKRYELKEQQCRALQLELEKFVGTGKRKFQHACVKAHTHAHTHTHTHGHAAVSPPHVLQHVRCVVAQDIVILENIFIWRYGNCC